VRLAGPFMPQLFERAASPHGFAGQCLDGDDVSPARPIAGARAGQGRRENSLPRPPMPTRDAGQEDDAVDSGLNQPFLVMRFRGRRHATATRIRAPGAPVETSSHFN